MANFGVSLPDSLLQAVDDARGPVPRSRWLREAAQARLDKDAVLVDVLEELVEGAAE